MKTLVFFLTISSAFAVPLARNYMTSSNTINHLRFDDSAEVQYVGQPASVQTYSVHSPQVMSYSVPVQTYSVQPVAYMSYAAPVVQATAQVRSAPASDVTHTRMASPAATPSFRFVADSVEMFDDDYLDSSVVRSLAQTRSAQPSTRTGASQPQYRVGSFEMFDDDVYYVQQQPSTRTSGTTGAQNPSATYTVVADHSLEDTDDVVYTVPQAKSASVSPNTRSQTSTGVQYRAVLDDSLEAFDDDSILYRTLLKSHGQRQTSNTGYNGQVFRQNTGSTSYSRYTPVFDQSREVDDDIKFVYVPQTAQTVSRSEQPHQAQNLQPAAIAAY